MIGEIACPSSAELDLRDPARVREVVRSLNPRLIINAGAYTSVDLAESNEPICHAINAVAPGILAEEARRIGAGMVHFSTDYVFDGDRNRPYLETDRPNPLNVYGRSKLAGEDAVREVGGVWLVLRTGWVYATRGKNFLLTMARMAKERESLAVVDDQLGSPTWARAIAAATGQILTRPFETTPGIYHLTAGGATTWHGFAKAIFEHLGTNTPKLSAISTDDYPLPAARPRYSVLDNTKLRETFGVSLQSWEEQLKLAIASWEPAGTGPAS